MEEITFDVVMAALKSGNAPLIAAALLGVAVMLARKYGPESWKGDVGGTALTFAGALSVALVGSLSGGALPSWALLLGAFKVAAVASGGYTMLKRLALPALRWLLPKVPVIGPLLAKALGDPAKKLEAAKAAGDAAVAADPPKGTGLAPKDIE